MSEHEISLLSSQREFLRSEAKLALYCGGVGSGKSFALSCWLFSMLFQYPDSKTLLCAPTYRQLRDSTLCSITTFLDSIGVHWRECRQDAVLWVAGRPLYYRSLENFDAVARGPEYGAIGIDEAAYVQEQGFRVLLGRLRCKHGARLLRCASTPNGFNWLYDVFVTRANNFTQLITARTGDNSHLPSDYEQTLRDQYDADLIQQELEGSFLALGVGRKYKPFSRARHIRDLPIDLRPGEQLHIGMDFNVNPMTCTIWALRDVAICLDEIVLKNAVTTDMVAAIAEWLRAHSYTGTAPVIYPDAAGAARKTAAVCASLSDHQILRQAGFILRNHSQNPPVKDRVNTVNGLFDHDRLLIASRCKETIADFEQENWDNTDDRRGHLADGVGYLCWDKWPLRRPQYCKIL